MSDFPGLEGNNNNNVASKSNWDNDTIPKD